jgi:hypothetical protein
MSVPRATASRPSCSTMNRAPSRRPPCPGGHRPAARTPEQRAPGFCKPNAHTPTTTPAVRDLPRASQTRAGAAGSRSGRSSFRRTCRPSRATRSAACVARVRAWSTASPDRWARSSRTPRLLHSSISVLPQRESPWWVGAAVLAITDRRRDVMDQLEEPQAGVDRRREPAGLALHEVRPFRRDHDSGFAGEAAVHVGRGQHGEQLVGRDVAAHAFQLPREGRVERPRLGSPAGSIRNSSAAASARPGRPSRR